MNFLIFRLYGPMASWGDTAVGQTRPSDTHPSKSAIIGLIGAALGIRRDEEEKQQSLARGYSFAVLVERPGIPMTDYHTIQVPSSGTGRNRKSFPTRRDEILRQPRHDLNCIISNRVYYMDAVYTAALWPSHASPPYGLEHMAHKLNNPVFMLYLGRKSCPLALPVEAQVLSAANLMEAFSVSDFKCLKEMDTFKKTGRRIYWENTIEAGINVELTFTRKDMPLSRKRWQFEARVENHAEMPED